MNQPAPPPLVMKFGGSSVADADRLREVTSLVVEALPRAPLVVLSAMGRTTNALFELARRAAGGEAEAAAAGARALVQRHRDQAHALLDGALPADLDALLAACTRNLELLLGAVALLRALSPQAMDAIAAHGERLSTALLAAHLALLGVEVDLFDARVVLRTDERHGAARPDLDATRVACAEHLGPHLRAGRAVVTQGYVGSTARGVTTTLGRGGSDYSAAVFGACLGACEVQVWTDVEGVLTTDPRLVPEALSIPELSFAEAAELAAFGAKVLHPATMQPVVDLGIPVTVRHTQRPSGAFTRITKTATTGRPVTAIAARGPITVLTVTSTRMLAQPGFLARLFDVFARAHVSVDLVATAEVSVSLTIEADAPLHDLVREIEAFATVAVAPERAIVALVGERLKHTPGLAARAFGALADIDVEMLSMGANEINLSFVVPQAAMPTALRLLHRELLDGGRAQAPRREPTVEGAFDA
ncbi:MAG: aspartate kinase [Planctomycetota bacterium]